MNTNNHVVNVPMPDYQEMVRAVKTVEESTLNIGIGLLIDFAISREVERTTLNVTSFNISKTDLFQKYISDFILFADRQGYKVKFKVINNSIILEDVTKND